LAPRGHQQIAYATHRETDCTSTPAMGTFESTLVTRLAARQVDVARRTRPDGGSTELRKESTRLTSPSGWSRSQRRRASTYHSLRRGLLNQLRGDRGGPSFRRLSLRLKQGLTRIRRSALVRRHGQSVRPAHHGEWSLRVPRGGPARGIGGPGPNRPWVTPGRRASQ
jgi:hypothetical protein